MRSESVVNLYNQHPWLALNLYLAFCEAKRISQAELFETAALKIGLPWVRQFGPLRRRDHGARHFPLRRRKEPPQP